eukprot:g9729.t1
MVFVRLYQRVSHSYEIALHKYEQRVAAGLQPTTPLVNLYSVDTEEALLVTTNFLYLGLVILLYLRMLKRKKPVRLRALMLGYNTLNVCISLFVACSLLYFKITSRGFVDGGGVGGDVSALSPGGVGGVGGFVCNPLRTDVQGQRVARVFAVFYLQKYLELVDTFLFVLRRSFRQVTFFHLFHHCSITVIVGSVLPFDFNGDMYLPIMLNSIVHVLVYLHYVLTALGKPSWSWWSRHLTRLQLAQFVVILVQSATAFYRGPSCGSPDFVKVVLLLYMTSLLGLFALFFAKRSILGSDDPGMCGVIKSLETEPATHKDTDNGGSHVVAKGREWGEAESTGGQGAGAATGAGAGTGAAWHGNVLLDERGMAEVRLPAGFVGEPPAGVTYSYQLTPLGVPMPGLFVSEEISPKTSGTSVGSSNGGGGGGGSSSSSSGTMRRRKSLDGGGSRSAGHRAPAPRSSFTIRGGTPRSSVSWTVTTVVLQESPRTASPPVGGGGGGGGVGCGGVAPDHDGAVALRPSYGKAGGKVEYCLGHAEVGMVNVVSKRCTHLGCTKRPSFGVTGGKAGRCRAHAEDGMVNLISKTCTHLGCTKQPIYGVAGGKAEYCRAHAENGMVDVINKRCTHLGCNKVRLYGMAGGKAKYCRDHAEVGMVNVVSKKCAHLGCSKVPLYGMTGGQKQYCRDHAEDGMVNVVNKTCAHLGCSKRPSFGKAGGKAEYCRDHAEDGMVDVRSQKCTHQGCTKQTLYGRAGGKPEYCRAHAEDGMIDVKSKRCLFPGCTTFANYGEENTRTRKFCAQHAAEGMVSISGRSSKRARQSDGEDL